MTSDNLLGHLEDRITLNDQVESQKLQNDIKIREDYEWMLKTESAENDERYNSWKDRKLYFEGKA